MKALTISCTAILLLTMAIPCGAQNAIVHIVLNDSARIAGIPLYLEDAKLIVQEDLERFSDGVSTPDEHAAICDNARVILLNDIASLYLERSSLAWMIGLSGGIVIGAALLYLLTSAYGSDGTLVKQSTVAGGIGGIFWGGIAAVIIHGEYGSDFFINLDDSYDYDALKRATLYPNDPPAALQALE